MEVSRNTGEWKEYRNMEEMMGQMDKAEYK